MFPEREALRNHLARQYKLGEDWTFLDDKEYSYAVGMVVKAMGSVVKNYRGSKVINKFIEQEVTTRKIKDELLNLWKEYTAFIDKGEALYYNEDFMKWTLSCIFLADDDEFQPIPDIIMAGFTSTTILTKEEIDKAEI